MFKKYLLLIGFFIKISVAIGQDSVILKEPLYYRIATSFGIGAGFPKQIEASNNGISLGASFELEKNKAIYTLGYRFVSVIQFNIFETNNLTNNIQSTDLTYGRAFKIAMLSASINAGLGYVTSVERGALISSTSRGPGFLSGYDDVYEKIKYHNIGVPISLKVFWPPITQFGIGADFYVNINKNTFYGANFSLLFGKLGPKRIRRHGRK
jgi:hypothetical protein